MSEGRFGKLEDPGGLPESLKAALRPLGRFSRLEIGETRHPAAPGGAAGRAPCPHCAMENEPERDHCWACHRALKAAPAPVAAGTDPHRLTIVLDGMPYRSDDPALPPEIRALMDRIRSEGYSPGLVEEWRSSRASAQAEARRADAGALDENRGRAVGEGGAIEVFRGQRVSIIKMDGKLHRSDDPKLEAGMRELFDFVEVHGVTPALMDYLRHLGRTVKYRPATTADPTAGDLAFWNELSRQADAAGRGPRAAAAPAARPWADLLSRGYYYLVPLWCALEATSWPGLRTAVVSDSTAVKSLFYALEAALGLGYWLGWPGIAGAALAENIAYLASAIRYIVITPMDIGLHADSPEAWTLAERYTQAMPGVLYSMVHVGLKLHRSLHGRAAGPAGAKAD